MIRILFFAVIKFYKIDVKQNELKKDIILNMITT